MKILITGCKGQLGTELIKCFKQGKTDLGVPEVLKQANDIAAIDVEELDITDKSACEKYFENNKFDCVINCAAYTNVNKAEECEDIALSVNAVGPKNLAEECQKQGAKFVQISTDYVFNGKSKTPYVETDECAPESAYGRTKYLGECYALQACEKCFVLRTAWLYGQCGNNFVKTMVKIGSANGKVTVVNDQFGTPTSASDLAHQILVLLPTENYGIFHATCEGECSWYDFAVRIMKLAKVSAEVIPCTTAQYVTPAKRPAYSVLENQRLKRLGINSFRNWEEALDDFFQKQ